MDWSGEFVFGRTWAAFRGSSADNSPHGHATLQVAIAHNELVVIRQPGGDFTSGDCLLVKPNVIHQLLPISMVTLIFIEPQTEIARNLMQQAGRCNVALLKDRPEYFRPSSPLVDVVSSLDRAATAPADIDTRLKSALVFLAGTSGPRAVSRAAQHAGLSTARLRALASDQLGTSLTAWLAWRRIERAGIALDTGASLAQAAYDAGFADQAHLSRATRQMFGITPGTAGDVVRSQAIPSISG